MHLDCFLKNQVRMKKEREGKIIISSLFWKHLGKKFVGNLVEQGYKKMYNRKVVINIKRKK